MLTVLGNIFSLQKWKLKAKVKETYWFALSPAVLKHPKPLSVLLRAIAYLTLSSGSVCLSVTSLSLLHQEQVDVWGRALKVKTEHGLAIRPKSS